MHGVSEASRTPLQPLNESLQSLCPICLSSLDPEPREARPCGHVFHISCIMEWRSTSYFNDSNLPCAMCRRTEGDLLALETNIWTLLPLHASNAEAVIEEVETELDAYASHSDIDSVSAQRSALPLSETQLESQSISHALQNPSQSDTSWRCERPGCECVHLRRPGERRWCCNGCFRGDIWHTNNCTGRDTRTLAPSTTTSWRCERRGCQHVHFGGPGNRLWCCNACKRGEEWHTDNCTGQHTRIINPVIHP